LLLVLLNIYTSLLTVQTFFLFVQFYFRDQLTRYPKSLGDLVLTQLTLGEHRQNRLARLAIPAGSRDIVDFVYF